MTIQYQCRTPDCLNGRKSWALTCGPCWKSIPSDLKEVLNSYRSETTGRRAAVRAILEWIKEEQGTLL